MEPRKDHVERADAVMTAEGSIPCAVLAWPRGLSGVAEQGMHALGFAREPGRPCRLRVTEPDGPPAVKGSRPTGAGAGLPWERMDGRQHGTAERRERSEAGRAAGSRSVL